MITEHPGLARQTYRRLREASGATDLDELEQRLDALAEAVGENRDLAGPLTELVARVEAQVVPALERRQRASAEGEVARDPHQETPGTGGAAL